MKETTKESDSSSNFPFTRRAAGNHTMMASETLSTQYNVWPTNQPVKPPLDGVSLAWRLKHAKNPLIIKVIGRALELVSHRRARHTHGPVLKQMALLSVMTHNRNRIHDGQVGIVKMPSLATSHSGQETQ